MTTLPFGHYWNGKSYTIQVLDRLPASARPLLISDMRDGQQVFYEVEIGTYKGKYFWDIITPESHEAIKQKALRGKAFEM